jgi:HPr kinase/phosphorylase
MALRLLDRGFRLVADDRVEVADGWASAPSALLGLLEVRGLGILRMPALTRARLALAVELDGSGERLPTPRRHDVAGVPLIAVDPTMPSAAQRVVLALECALGKVAQAAGAFA